MLWEQEVNRRVDAKVVEQLVARVHSSTCALPLKINPQLEVQSLHEGGHVWRDLMKETPHARIRTPPNPGELVGIPPLCRFKDTSWYLSGTV